MGFFRILAAALSALGRGVIGVASVLDFVWRSLFGGGGGRRPPHFTPQSTVEILDEFDEKRARAAAVPELDRDSISTVSRYVKALPGARSTFDLSGLKKEVRVTLLTMSDLELRTLSHAGIGAVRKFVAGHIHGVDGVPVVKVKAFTQEPRTKPTEELRWKLQGKAIKAPCSEAFRLPSP